jgi:REP element-mobilizing transposase RayT
MGYVKIWIHAVWTTRNREPLLEPDLRRTIFTHIRENVRKKEIYLDFINGYKEHVHALISLNSNQSIDKVVMLLKGESSFRVNKSGLTATKFGWQDEYFAVSVSESLVPRVRSYIAGQEEHHRRKTFQEENDELMSRYGFNRFVSG